MEKIAWRDKLKLPAGWTAVEFPDYVELTSPDGQTKPIPKPYVAQPEIWWLQQAEKILRGESCV